MFRKLILTAAALGLVLVAGTATASTPHATVEGNHNTVTLQVGSCYHAQGKYFVTAIVDNSSDVLTETLSGASLMADRIDGHPIPASAGAGITETFAPGSVLQLTVTGTWTDAATSTDTSNRVTVPSGGCKKTAKRHH